MHDSKINLLAIFRKFPLFYTTSRHLRKVLLHRFQVHSFGNLFLVSAHSRGGNCIHCTAAVEVAKMNCKSLSDDFQLWWYALVISMHNNSHLSEQSFDWAIIDVSTFKKNHNSCPCVHGFCLIVSILNDLGDIDARKKNPSSTTMSSSLCFCCLVIKLIWYLIGMRNTICGLYLRQQL